VQRIRTLYLVVLAFFSVALVEGSLVAVAVSAENQTVAFWATGFVETVFMITLGAFALTDQYGWTPRKLTADPLRTWMLLHAIYWLAGVLNGVILYGLLLYVAFGTFSSNWIALTGISFVLTLAANFLLMRALGQEYQSLRGSSLTGAASFARLARGMIERQNRYGVNQLILSVKMARAIFRGLLFVPQDMDAVVATLVTMRETGSLHIGALSQVAQSLEQLPKPDSLPDAFRKLLDTLSWPRGFKTIEGPQRSSDYPKLTIIFTAVLAVAGVIALLSEPIRQGGLQTLANFAFQNSLKVGGATALSIAFLLVVRTISWPVPFIALRYWPRGETTTKRT
jgi:hypothetical protein